MDDFTTEHQHSSKRLKVYQQAGGDDEATRYSQQQQQQHYASAGHYHQHQQTQARGYAVQPNVQAHQYYQHQQQLQHQQHYQPYQPYGNMALQHYGASNTPGNQYTPQYAAGSYGNARPASEAWQGGQGGIRIPQNGMTGRIPTQYSICRHYQQRQSCRVGHACRFAHGEAELEHWNRHYTLKAVTGDHNKSYLAPNSNPHTAVNQNHASSGVVVATAASSGAGTVADPYESLLPPRNPPGTTTMLKQPRTFVLCRHFSIRGECKSGLVCKFAHGVHELDYWNALNGRQRATPSEISHQMTVNLTKADLPKRPLGSPTLMPAQQMPAQSTEIATLDIVSAPAHPERNDTVEETNEDAEVVVIIDGPDDSLPQLEDLGA